MAHPPKSLQGVLWSSSINQLDLDKHRAYIIHQVLTFGTMNQLRWLFKAYSKYEITDVFVHQPIKMYPRHIYWFTKNHLLPLRHAQLDEQNYVTALFGPTRPRAAARV